MQQQHETVALAMQLHATTLRYFPGDGGLRPSMAAELMARSQKRVADASVLQVGSHVNDFHTKLASLGFPSDRTKITVRISSLLGAVLA